MATYSVNVTESYSYFPDNLSGSQATIFAVTNSLAGASYYTLETVPPFGWYYSGSTPSISGSFTYTSGINNLVSDNYKMSVVVAPGGGSFTFTPAVPITGSQLLLRGTGYKDVNNQANAIASSFAAAVNGAGGLLTGSEYNALLALTSDLISYNLLSKMKAVYPVVSSQRNLASYTEASTIGYNVQGVSLTSTTQASPINTNTAVRITYTTPGNPYCYQIHTLAANTQYVFSVYLRAVSGTPTVLLNINYANGSADAASKTVTLSTSWQRYELTFNTAALSNNFFTVIKNISADLEFWGWQLEPGSTATAYQATLGLADDVFKNSFKFNLVNPSRFTGSFSSGWTFASTGMTGNGTSAYMDTGLSPSANLAQNSISGGVYVNANATFGTNLNRTDVLLGASNSAVTSFSNGFYLLPMASSDSKDYSRANQDVQTGIPSWTDPKGFFQVYRTSSPPYIVKRNTVNANYSWGSTPPTSNNIWIGGLNASGSLVEPSNNRIAFTYIGDGLTDTDASLFYLAVQRYQTLLNRQV